MNFREKAEKEKSDAERYRQNPIYKTDLNKPKSQVIEDIRHKMTDLRGMIHDFQFGFPGWKERTEHVEGLLTCGLIALHYTKEELIDFEIKSDDIKFGKSLKFGPRGIGTDSVPCCFTCGKSEQEWYSNISAFVDSKENGEEIVIWFGGRARLDFRPSEPNWIQLKVGSCEEHLPNLKFLYEKTSEYGRIRHRDIVDAVNFKEEQVG